EVPPPLEAIVMRCLERNAAQRYPSARAVAAELVAFGSPRGVLAANRIRSSTLSAPPAPTANAARVGGDPMQHAPAAPGFTGQAGRMTPPVASGTPFRAMAHSAGVPPSMAQSGGVPLPPAGLAAPPYELRAGVGTAAAWGQTGSAAKTGTNKAIFVGVGL